MTHVKFMAYRRGALARGSFVHFDKHLHTGNWRYVAMAFYRHDFFKYSI